MSEKLGPLEVLCDSPPYPIVQACSLLGFTRPADVRWCRLSQFLVDRAGWWAMYRVLAWDAESMNRCLRDGKCSCGEALPQLHRCLFSVSTGQSWTYVLGQCVRCKSMFWEEG